MDGASAGGLALDAIGGGMARLAACGDAVCTALPYWPC